MKNEDDDSPAEAEIFRPGENLPSQNESPGAKKSNGSGGILAIETLNYYGNDLREFRLLAEANPDIAEKLLKNHLEETKIFSGGYRFGVSAIVVLILATLATLTTLVISGGILVFLAAIPFLIAMAFVFRVILTGEWSETTWIGWALKAISSALNGNLRKVEDDKSET